MIITIQDGELRAIVQDDLDIPDLVASLGVLPDRASSIEIVKEGPKRGHWMVEFSPLANSLGDPFYRCCLVECFRKRSDAIAAEVVWLQENFLGVTNGT